jgi:hypothetical protein
LFHSIHLLSDFSWSLVIDLERDRVNQSLDVPCCYEILKIFRPVGVQIIVFKIVDDVPHGCVQVNVPFSGNRHELFMVFSRYHVPVFLHFFVLLSAQKKPPWDISPEGLFADLRKWFVLHDFFLSVEQAPITEAVVPAFLADKIMIHHSSHLEDHFLESCCHGQAKRPCNPSQCSAVVPVEFRRI